MYTPRSFAQTDIADIHSLIRRYPFASLITHHEGTCTASHLPMLLDANLGERGVLVGHMARANPQWRHQTEPALVLFQGPHAYISANWYAEPATVPTWNYVAVHVTGPIEAIENSAELLDLLGRSAEMFDPGSDGWRFDPADESIHRMLREIVGFRIPIQSIEAKWKLSQNHSPERRRRVIERLETSDDPFDRAIAQLMREASDPGGIL